MGLRIRPIDASSGAELELVAERMRDTLVEVLGEERGGSMYSMEWLLERARFHLHTPRISEIFVAEDAGQISGHSIVRAELEDGASVFGLFSTTYVTPAARRQGVAQQLLAQGESWMRRRGLPSAATYTAKGNSKLIGLYQKRGYRITFESDEMLKLAREL